jgi:hypothetical protein
VCVGYFRDRKTSSFDLPFFEVSNLLQRFSAIPFYGLGHRRLKLPQVFRCAPTNIVMLGRRESQRALFGPRPINHADMFVGIGDAMDVQKTRSDQRARSRRSGWRSFADEFHFEAAFFPRFAESGLFGIFIEFDMPAERKPFVELTMVDQQDFAVANDKDCDCEINFFVNMRHAN